MLEAVMAASHLCRPIARVLWIAVSLLSHAATQPTQVLRWSESQPGCAFQAGDDGTYRYALATDNFVVTLAMDAQELEKARRRIEPVVGLFLSVRFLKQTPSPIALQQITLEFVKHFHTIEAPLNPAELAARLQADDKKEVQIAAREIRKHPEKKADLEATLRTQQQSTSQMIEWSRTKTLQPISKDDNEISGWLLFAASTRWIGALNRQEEFLLRVPLGNLLVEFPFTLPPSQDDVRLRTRSPN
jgi:hypothetical protein